MAGLWDTPDLTAVIRVAARNVDGIDRVRRRLAFVRVPYQRMRAAFLRNTPTRSRKDIAAHYDLGNELFSRMLDPTLMYSCAVFEDGDVSLEQASIAKLETVCDKLDLGPADHVLEIGTVGADCGARRPHAGLPGHDHDDLEGAIRHGPRTGAARPVSRAASRCCSTTIAICAAATTSSCRSR